MSWSSQAKEELLGMYDFRDRPTIFYPAATDPTLLRCTEVHEHTHWLMACSTTFGYFQLVLARLKSAFQLGQTSQVFYNLLEKTVRASWYVYEGLATLEELRSIRHRDKSQEKGWREELRALPKYANALKCYEDTIERLHVPDCLGWGIAYRFADLALNSFVLRDFRVDFQPNEKKLAAYLDDPINNPDQRLSKFLHTVIERLEEFRYYIQTEILSPFAEELGLNPQYFLEVEGYPDVEDRDVRKLEAMLDEKLRLYFAELLPDVLLVPSRERDSERYNFSKSWYEHYIKQGVDLNEVQVLRTLVRSEEESESWDKCVRTIYSDLQPSPGTLLSLQEINDPEEFVRSHSDHIFYCRLCPLALVNGKLTAFMGRISLVIVDSRSKPIELEVDMWQAPAVLCIMHRFQRFEKQCAVFEKEGWFYLLPFGRLRYFVEITNKINTFFVVLDHHVDFDSERVFNEMDLTDFHRPLYVVPHITSAAYLALYLGWIARVERQLKLYTIQVGTEGLTFLVSKPEKGSLFSIIGPITGTTKSQLAEEIGRIPYIIPCQSFQEYESDEAKIEQAAIAAEHISQYGY